MATTKKTTSKAKKTTEAKTTKVKSVKPTKTTKNAKATTAKVTKTIKAKAPAKKTTVVATSHAHHENFSKFLITIVIALAVILFVGAALIYNSGNKSDYKMKLKEEKSQMTDSDSENGYNY